MPSPTTLPQRVLVALAACVCLVAVRYMAAIESGVPHLTAVRTYLFWGLVLVPVAYLADILGRTIMRYRVVELVRAKVRND